MRKQNRFVLCTYQFEKRPQQSVNDDVTNYHRSWLHTYSII